MPYASFDDHFPDHPKIAPLSDAAFRLHVAGICYAARHLTDGIVPAVEVPRLVRAYRKTSLAALTAEAALWVPRPGGDYEIHDYLDWNLSRAKVLERRENAAKLARKRWGT